MIAPMEPLRRVDEALHGQDPNQLRIARAGIDLTATLLAKNKDYGSSAWEAPLLAPHLNSGDAILCRMSDKIKRIQSLLAGNDPQVDESLEDTIKDLAGYSLLWLARPKDEA